MDFPSFEQETNISFEYELPEFSLDSEDQYRAWLIAVARMEFKVIGELNYIFCSDAYLQDINWKYLKHTSLTDIITFQYDPSTITADIYISIERVTENAAKHHVDFKEEYHRVMAHGLLHCLGYKDKTDAEKAIMRQKEQEALDLRIAMNLS